MSKNASNSGHRDGCSRSGRAGPLCHWGAGGLQTQARGPSSPVARSPRRSPASPAVTCPGSPASPRGPRAGQAAKVASLPAQVHFGRWQQDQDGRVRGARARPAARQRLLRAGVPRPRVRGAVGSVGFKLLRWARGEKPGRSPRPAPASPPPPLYLPSALSTFCPPGSGIKATVFLDPL